MNQLHNLRVSVGTTWRFTTTPAGMATVAEDVIGYRHRIDGLKGRPAVPAGSGFNLPWPTYYSKLWGYLFGREHENTQTPLLVGALLPLLSMEPAELKAVEPAPDMPFAYVHDCEAFLHPFAVTTVLHLLVPSGLPDGREAECARRPAQARAGRRATPGRCATGHPFQKGFPSRLPPTQTKNPHASSR